MNKDRAIFNQNEKLAMTVNGLESGGMHFNVNEKQADDLVKNEAISKFNTQVDEYVNGVYGDSYTFYATEGEIIHLEDDIHLYPGATVTVEADTFVAYEGAVGKTNWIGNVVFD